ncbi:hypothetical protein FHW89_005782 [Mucilaginibacter sp. SG564]|nr:hypothetical protein [Mucilaginibacter sp. SG564]
MLKLGNNSVTRQHLILYIPVIAKHIRGVFFIFAHLLLSNV